MWRGAVCDWEAAKRGRQDESSQCCATQRIAGQEHKEDHTGGEREQAGQGSRHQTEDQRHQTLFEEAEEFEIEEGVRKLGWSCL